ncbi:hypothetical protein KI387_007055 [Taxus chinensis]|uniref:Uncharacterized protein n=1 Tax=Taxus chinensis TaxID=29808 RepID=A0AA38GNQ6_TAXCH|nr:hypothetical protein KI387_007055 [Taxus chinensis]
MASPGKGTTSMTSPKTPGSGSKRKVSPTVGTYAVQCVKCFKWRKIPSKEQYEAIRQSALEDPWVCSRASAWSPRVSCDDPTDLSPDMSRLWVIDKPNIPCPPKGWERLLTLRGEGTCRFADVYYISPCGKRLRSMVEIERFLEENTRYGATISDFNFQIPRPLHDSKRSASEAQIQGDTGANSNLFREYIGAEFTGVKFSDLPINANTQFDFILSFTIDYTTSSPHSPTNGKFNIFLDSETLSPNAIQAIKSKHKNGKVALSLGGDSVGKGYVQFMPSSMSSWVDNAVSSLTNIIQQYHLDDIDINYEHFDYSDPNTFSECIGQLITQLKKKNIVSFASIAPFDNEQVQSHYSALWNKYGHIIDYVNFQFYAYATAPLSPSSSNTSTHRPPATVAENT